MLPRTSPANHFGRPALAAFARALTRGKEEKHMKFSKTLFAGVLSVALMGTWSIADDAKETKTVSGKSSCAQCDGIPTSKKHEIMVVDKDGMRWVLLADKESKGYKEAHKVRKD